MANPIIAVLSIAGVAGMGVTAATVNANVVEQASQEPVVVTVEGEPIVVDGGTVKTVAPKVGTTDGTAPAPSTTVDVPAVQAAPVVQVAPAPAVAPAAPATHTGASGGGEHEEEDEDEYEIESHDDHDDEDDD